MALLVFAVVDIGVTWYGYLQTSAFATLVGATAIIPYIIYFLITAGYAYKRRTLDSIPGVFSLGRWAWPVIIFVLVYSALIIFVLSVPSPFHSADKVRRLRRGHRGAVVRRRAGLAAAAGYRGSEADRGAGRLARPGVPADGAQTLRPARQATASLEPRCGYSSSRVPAMLFAGFAPGGASCRAATAGSVVRGAGRPSRDGDGPRRSRSRPLCSSV